MPSGEATIGAEIEAAEAGEEAAPRQLTPCGPSCCTVQLPHGRGVACAQDAGEQQQRRYPRGDPGRDLEPQTDDRVLKAVERPIAIPLCDRHAVLISDEAGTEQEDRRRKDQPENSKCGCPDQSGKRLGGQWPIGELTHRRNRWKT